MKEIANLGQICEYLNCVIDGSIKASVLVNIRDKVNSYYEEVFVSASEKEKLKASELLYKIYENPPKDSSVKKDSSVIVDDMSQEFEVPQKVLHNDVDETLVEEFDGKYSSILEYLTSVMNGSSVATVIVNVKGESGYFSEEFVKSPSHEERLKASEILYKYYLTATIDLSELTLPLIVGGD